MTTQETINALESRQLELRAIMRSSDAHAAKCAKLDKKFSEEYPDAYSEYVSANTEFNENEATLAELYSTLVAEGEVEVGPGPDVEE